MMRRRGRPLRRAAVIGGTAAIAHNAGKKSGQAQAEQAEQAQPQYAPPPPDAPAPPAAGGGDMVSQLQDLKKLLDEGVLTQAEFDMQKQKILAAS